MGGGPSFIHPGLKGLLACNQPYTGSRLLSKPVSANHSASTKHKSLLLDLIN